jgi:hypothetical protein
MSSGHDFKHQLANVHNVYFKASAPGKKLIGSSIVLGSSGEKWRLSLVLVPDTGDLAYYEKNLTYTDLMAMVRGFYSVTFQSQHC